ncbi:MAG: hypothetical protein LBE61_01310 [Burkholderiaceae bacterium]|jgi:hypothetical protein|nr:hypothetical protein [Burkholderiaceae bacterium]
MDFLTNIEHLPIGARQVLRERKLILPALLMETPDHELLDIKGIGPTKLRILRRACAAALQQRDSHPARAR